MTIFGSARVREDHPAYERPRSRSAGSSPRPASRSSPAAGPASWRPRTAGPGGRRALGRLQHRATARAVLEPVSGRRASPSALLRAQDDVREARRGLRHLPRRLRHARRALRGPDAHPDRASSCTSRSSSSTPTTGTACWTGSTARSWRGDDLPRGSRSPPRDGRPREAVATVVDCYREPVRRVRRRARKGRRSVAQLPLEALDQPPGAGKERAGEVELEEVADHERVEPCLERALEVRADLRAPARAGRTR